MKNYSIYIKIYEKENRIHSSGVKFQDFAKGLSIQNQGLLILAGYPNECKFNMHLLLEYVTKEQLEALVNETVYNYGDFCWVDYEREEQLNHVTGEELAQLLYMSHMKRPLDSFKIDSLNNRYAYLCHDDGWWNNVYMKNVTEYKKVISYLLMQKLKGRKQTISEPNPELMHIIFEMCKDGLVIDFEKKTTDGVSLFCVGTIETMDDLEKKMDRYRNKASGRSVYYNSRKKSWESYGMQECVK